MWYLDDLKYLSYNIEVITVLACYDIYGHEIKRLLLLERKAVTNVDSIWKSRDITLLTKVHIVKVMVFPVVIYGCESWTIKKAEHQRSAAFELWWWGRLKSPLDNKEIKPVNPTGNQPCIFIGKTDAEVKVPILWPLNMKIWLIGKDLMLGKIEGKRRRGRQRMRWLDGTTDSLDICLSKLWEITKFRKAWCASVYGVIKSDVTYLVTEQQQQFIFKCYLFIYLDALGFSSGDQGLNPGPSALGRHSPSHWTPGGGHGIPLRYSCLENPHWQGSLKGYSPRGCKELDITERLITVQPLDHQGIPYLQIF